MLEFSSFVATGSVSRELASFLEVVAHCRLNIVISGGTGSGKTTLLNALSRMIDAGERIITIEDAAELQLQQAHVLSLETRPPNVEGRGEINQRDLMRNALRMRPDRIIVGEVRGGEAFDMMQAMNTGHNGSMSTIHANSAREALARIENMILMGTGNLPIRAIRTQLVGALDLIIQTERMRDGVRRVTEVVEVVGMEGDVITLSPLFLYKYEGENVRRHAARTVRSRAPCGLTSILVWSISGSVPRCCVRSASREGNPRISRMLLLAAFASRAPRRRIAHGVDHGAQECARGEGKAHEPHPRRKERPTQKG